MTALAHSSRSRTRFRIGSGIAAVIAVALTIGAASATSVGATTRPATAAPRTLESASALARSSGQPTEVTSQTTETSQVVANPDGTFTMTSSTEAVRVKSGSTWRAIDPTLRLLDGRIAPVATSQSVSFSAGGSTPLVRLTDGDRTVDVSWPDPLPKPTLTGRSATYASVLPGVDLVMTASAESYSQVLVVHDAKAASNPRLAKIKFDIAARGLDVSVSSDGALQATDASGAKVFGGATPIMWDSHTTGGDRPSATDVGAGHVSHLGLDLSTIKGTVGSASGSLVLTPPALTGTDVTYPVYVDPIMDGRKQHMLVTYTNGGYLYDNTSEPLKVGACPVSSGDCNGIGTARSFFSVGTSTITPRNGLQAHIFSADVQVYQMHGALSCTPEPVELWSSTGFTSGTRWPGTLAGNLQTVSSGASDDCATNQPRYLDFNGPAVLNQVQSSVNLGATSLSFGLKAPNEGDTNQWKKFASTGGSSFEPQLEVHFGYPPSTPTGRTIDDSIKCAGQPLYVTSRTPTFRAQATDNNPSPGNVALWFQVQDGAGGNVRRNPSAVVAPSSATRGWTTNSDNTNSTAPLPDGVYGFHVRADTLYTDGTPNQSSATTDWSYFTLDHVAPSVPTLSSFDYPNSAWGRRLESAGTSPCMAVVTPRPSRTRSTPAAVRSRQRPATATTTSRPSAGFRPAAERRRSPPRPCRSARTRCT